MTINQALPDLRRSLSKDEERVLLDLFTWYIHDCDDYNQVIDLKVKNKTTLQIFRKDRKKPTQLPLIGSFFGILLPYILEEFSLTVKYFGLPLGNHNLAILHREKYRLYDYFYEHGIFPTADLLEIWYFIHEKEDYQGDSPQDKKEYTHKAMLI
jgi:hypothetical protein